MQAINCCIPGPKLTSLFKLFFFARSSCNWLKHYLCEFLYYAGILYRGFDLPVPETGRWGQQWSAVRWTPQSSERSTETERQNGALIQRTTERSTETERQNEHWYRKTEWCNETERLNGALIQKDRMVKWNRKTKRSTDTERQNGVMKQKDRTEHWYRKTERSTDTKNDRTE